jgi:hypothetical protein
MTISKRDRESITHFAHWCASRRIDLAEIDESAVKSFLCRHLPLCRCAKRCQPHSAAAALGHLLDYLRIENRIAPKKSPYPAMISEELRRQKLKYICTT